MNNAGVQTWKPLLDLQESDWDRVIDTNLKGCFLCTQRAAFQGGSDDVPMASLSRNIEIDLKEMIKDTGIPAPLAPKNFMIL